jgi:predicted PurR-regulated permease PerM
MTKHLIRIGAAVMTALLALMVLWNFRIVVLYFLISLVLAAVLRPLAMRLERCGRLARVAWIIFYVAAVGVFGFLLFFFSETALKEVQQLALSVAVQDEWRLPVWLENTSFQHALVTGLPPPSQIFEAVTGSQGQLVLPAILGLSQDISVVVSGFVIILFMSIYWSISQVHFERLWLSLLASDQRKQARGIWRVIESNIGAYIRSQFIHSLLGGLLFGLGYWLLGSPYPALLAMAGALLCLIPVVGAVAAVILPFVLGMLTSVELGLVTALFTLICLIVLGVWVKPRLFNRHWDNPILSVILLIGLADAFGLAGMIIAPPVSVVCQILWRHLVTHHGVVGAALRVSDLVERKDHVTATIQAMEGQVPPLVTSSMQRLTQLMDKAEPFLQEKLPVESAGSD